jgi:hypothetical protein
MASIRSRSSIPSTHLLPFREHPNKRRASLRCVSLTTPNLQNPAKRHWTLFSLPEDTAIDAVYAVCAMGHRARYDEALEEYYAGASDRLRRALIYHQQRSPVKGTVRVMVPRLTRSRQLARMYEDHRASPTPPTVGSTVGTHCRTNELETSPPKLPHAAK